MKNVVKNVHIFLENLTLHNAQTWWCACHSLTHTEIAFKHRTWIYGIFCKTTNHIKNLLVKQAVICSTDTNITMILINSRNCPACRHLTDDQTHHCTSTLHPVYNRLFFDCPLRRKRLSCEANHEAPLITLCLTFPLKLVIHFIFFFIQTFTFAIFSISLQFNTHYCHMATSLIKTKGKKRTKMVEGENYITLD